MHCLAVFFGGSFEVEAPQGSGRACANSVERSLAQCTDSLKRRTRRATGSSRFSTIHSPSQNILFCNTIHEMYSTLGEHRPMRQPC